jgi:acyl-CoA synthetase (AMP-forming)/AMP-acid ligase II
LEYDVTTLSGRRASQRWNRMAVGDLLERVCWAAPDKEAIIGCEGAFGSPQFERLTYARADQAANRVANALRAEGLRRGDRVLLFCDNSVEALLVLFGIAFCRERLAGYETPKRVIVVDEMPETVGGKILKYRLRESLGDLTQVNRGGIVAP